MSLFFNFFMIYWWLILTYYSLFVNLSCIWYRLKNTNTTKKYRYYLYRYQSPISIEKLQIKIFISTKWRCYILTAFIETFFFPSRKADFNVMASSQRGVCEPGHRIPSLSIWKHEAQIENINGTNFRYCAIGIFFWGGGTKYPRFLYVWRIRNVLCRTNFRLLFSPIDPIFV